MTGRRFVHLHLRRQPKAGETRVCREGGRGPAVDADDDECLHAPLRVRPREARRADDIHLRDGWSRSAGLGVLFEGDPGLGKSETALGLVKRGCALVADDLTCIRKDVGNNILFGSASAATAGFMEISGIGIMHIPSVFGVCAVRGEKHLELIITFKRLDDVKGEIDRIGQTRRVKNILGVDIPNVVIPVSAGRDLVNLVETAAMQQKLIMSGYDPVQELSERLRKRADIMQFDKNEKSKRKGKRNG